MKAGKVAEKYMTAQVENLDKKFEDAYKAAGVKVSIYGCERSCCMGRDCKTIFS